MFGKLCLVRTLETSGYKGISKLEASASAFGLPRLPTRCPDANQSDKTDKHHVGQTLSNSTKRLESHLVVVYRLLGDISTSA